MDFKTTEVAADLGGLVRTITESVAARRNVSASSTGSSNASTANLWAKLIEADVTVGHGSQSRWAAVGLGDARGRPPCWPRWAASLSAGALPGFGGAAAPVRWPRSAPRGCSRWAAPADQRRQDPGRGVGRRGWVEAGAGSRPTVRQTPTHRAVAPRSATDRSPTRSWFRPKPIRDTVLFSGFRR